MSTKAEIKNDQNEELQTQVAQLQQNVETLTTQSLQTQAALDQILVFMAQQATVEKRPTDPAVPAVTAPTAPAAPEKEVKETDA